MRREQRLRHARDFAEAYRHGRVHANHLLVVRTKPNGGLPARFGVVAGKALGKAVVRNRVKRRLRAALDALAVAPGVDVVVSARGRAADAPYAELAASVRSLLAKAGVLARDPAAPSPGSSRTGAMRDVTEGTGGIP
jgi:ribonuclease P protein component